MAKLRSSTETTRLQGYAYAAVLILTLSLAVLPSPAQAGIMAAAQPALTVTPNTGLIDGQQVDVAGAGFAPSDFITITQCATTPIEAQHCDSEIGEWTSAGPDGSFALEYQVTAIIHTSAGDEVDCRQPGACRLAAALAEDEIYFADLTFDPDAPVLPPPVISVQPGQDLVDGQEVEIRGEDFRPGEQVDVAQCRTDPWPEDDCHFNTLVETQADADGRIVLQFTVLAEITAGHQTTDCRTSAEPCVIIAARNGSIHPRTPRAELHFDPDAPLLPPPRMSVAPSTGISEGESVEVVGTGFAPYGMASVSLCEAGTDPFVGRCAIEGGQSPTPDAEGRIQTRINLHSSFIATDDGGLGDVRVTVDCRQAPGCEVIGADHTRQRFVRVPVSFAPLPPADSFVVPAAPPTVEAPPATAVPAPADFTG